jgi:hypothetical protein
MSERVLCATGFGDETTSLPYTRRVLPTSIQQTFCPAVLAELMVSVPDRSLPYPIITSISLEGYHTFSAAQLNLKKINSSYAPFSEDLKILSHSTHLIRNSTNVELLISSAIPFLVKSISGTATQDAILAAETAQRFVNAAKRIQELVPDLNGQQASLKTFVSSLKLSIQWANLTSFFRDVTAVALLAVIKWLNVRFRFNTVAIDPSLFNNETIEEIIDLIQDAEHYSSTMYNVTKMYLDMSNSIKFDNAYKVLLNCNNLTDIDDVYDLRERCNNQTQDQRYIEGGRPFMGRV